MAAAYVADYTSKKHDGTKACGGFSGAAMNSVDQNRSTIFDVEPAVKKMSTGQLPKSRVAEDEKLSNPYRQQYVPPPRPVSTLAPGPVDISDMSIADPLAEAQARQMEEAKKFDELQTKVIWYSGVAGVSDIVPGIGLVAVPGIQWKLLSDLADSYGTKWSKAVLADLLGALGAGIGVRYSMKFGTRQVVKFLPGWGQTVGAASAAVMSFCTTYAIGRVACKYMYHKNRKEEVSHAELRELFYSAFDSVKTVAGQEVASVAQAERGSENARDQYGTRELGTNAVSE